MDRHHRLAILTNPYFLFVILSLGVSFIIFNNYEIPILFLLAVAIVLFITFQKPRLVLFMVFVLMPFIASGFRVPIPGVRNFGLTQILFPFMLVATYALFSRKKYVHISNINILIIILGLWSSLTILVQRDFSSLGLWIVFTSLPWYFIWLAGKVFIEDEKTLHLFVKALIVQAIIISSFSVYEYYTGFNLFEYFNPGVQKTVQLLRFGFLRSSGGIFPHSVPAAVYLSLVLPFSIAYMWRDKLALISVPLSLIALFFFQGRSAIFSLIIAILIAVCVSSSFRVDLMKFKKIIIGMVIITVFFNVDIMREYGTMLLNSIDFSKPESINLSTRYPDFFTALSKVADIPFWGFGLDTEATISRYRLCNEQPWFIDTMFKGGIVYGLLREAYLVFGSVYLIRLIRKRTYMPLGIRVAALVGFMAQAIAMHINRDSYGFVNSVLILGAMEGAERMYGGKKEI
jgi:hypothetical protein